ncbi:hypothetical protein BDW74DRAFT_190126 [Aspergillus multicolor]|uniref:uncharacterized protein n=1 Tax=Aspergillus multicolor TaxID=41759 RepID=UPI003CCCCC9B
MPPGPAPRMMALGESAAAIVTSKQPGRRSILHGPKILQLEERPLPPPATNEVQIAIRSTTLRGSDAHYYAHHRNGSITVKEPLCGGHEAAGVIVAVGSDTADSKVKVGDKVAIESGVPCSLQDCSKCSKGQYNVCPNLRFRSSGAAFPHFQGTLQEYVNYPAAWVHKLPDSFGFDEGALLEPLAVCIHAARRARIEQEQSVLMFGAGAVGMLAAAVVKIEYGARVVIVDVDSGRVDFAVAEGFADVGYTVPPRPRGETVGRFDVVLECNGVESCVQASIYAAASGGKIDSVSVWRYAHCYPRAIEIMCSVACQGLKPDIRKLIVHRFKGLEAIPEAYDTAAKTRDAASQLVSKVVVNL